MKKFTVALLFITGINSIWLQAPAQHKIPVRYFQTIRSESQLSYCFFLGPDAGDFATSINGFGSGILDFFNTRTSLDIIHIGSGKLYVSVGAGFTVMKYRLANNLVFSKTGGNALIWANDPDITHNYVNTFFGYGKSKIITTSFYFPLDINMEVSKKVILTAGGYMDLNLTARYKMKYLVGEDKVKEIIRSSEFRNFNPSLIKFGVNATLFFKKTGSGISASYSFTPLFKTGLGPDIHEARVSASYTIRNFKQIFKERD
jgi:hypothetical protein